MSFTDEEMEAMMTAVAAGMGMGQVGTTEYDPWSPYTQTPLDSVIVAGTAPELTGVELEEAQWMPTLPEQAVSTPDVTTRDIFETYNNLSEEERQSVNEKMFSSGFYGQNANPNALENPDKGFRALGYAIRYYATQGVTPFDGLPDADMSKLVKRGPIIRRATEAQINALADSAAGNLLGRNATAEERQLAMSVIRSLETSSSLSPSQADVEAAFAESAPQEVAARGSEKALKVFESIVRGR